MLQIRAWGDQDQERQDLPSQHHAQEHQDQERQDLPAEHLAQAAEQDILYLAELDSSRPVAGGWQPGVLKPQTVADHPFLG